MQLQEGKKVYFASDMHFGIPSVEESHKRERFFNKWLDEIKADAAAIYIVGDIFDFWMEYKNAVPRGYTRFLGKISEITDSGIPVIIMRGNHDTWLRNYLVEECGCTYEKGVHKIEINEKSFYIHHGDGLAPKGYDGKYKFLKKVLNNRLCIWLYSLLHPNWGIKLALFFSRKSRMAGGQSEGYTGPENEWLTMYARSVLEQEDHYHYFIFGHRHLPLDVRLEENSRYINLGDWLSFNSYACFDGEDLELKFYETDPPGHLSS